MSVRALALSVGTCLGSGGVERAQDHDIRRNSYVASLFWADMDDVVIGGYSSA